MTTNEYQLETLKVEHDMYKKELEQLQLSVKNNSAIIDTKLFKVQRKLDDSYNKILNLQEKIALELKARRL